MSSLLGGLYQFEPIRTENLLKVTSNTVNDIDFYDQCAISFNCWLNAMNKNNITQTRVDQIRLRCLISDLFNLFILTCTFFILWNNSAGKKLFHRNKNLRNHLECRMSIVGWWGCAWKAIFSVQKNQTANYAFKRLKCWIKSSSNVWLDPLKF